MNHPLADDNPQQDSSLILFITGDAPRSRRARHNLKAGLEASGLGAEPAQEIDLLNEPQEALHFGVFATPALMHIDASGNCRVLYGDLADQGRLKDFLNQS